ncbi:MAG TPA: NAD(P)H-dependent oxidoreductase subunit E [Desulfobacteraceae bacterium]|nr:NAD(P)H-dependent oxidoreductase subunit E [Deltaproteobacteria bacterium]MBW2356533.1 NAD(P)H-dependent oxidoreductase subunit E [Deltaproteobacteria bacterium]RLB98446.1 MAG: NAD(P)H-dependent oxidoreductase subunit E [Deltaproteobacteria bacterium]HDI60108.1 NAD(P)H-dependent oxidoreductase subunit E [Desulfobacteraceae bacterium]
MQEKVAHIIGKYHSDKGFLVPILQDVQKEFNYLPKEALTAVGTQLQVPLSRIYEVATFYRAFSLTPRGKHQLSLCVGTACHVRGAPMIQDGIERVLDIRAGQTTADLEFTFETVNCLGACALGPILVVDGEYQGQVTLSKANKLLKKLGKKVATDEED